MSHDTSPELGVFDKNGIFISSERQLQVIEQISSLPANVSEVVEACKKMILNNTVCIIRWETWAGKTTQVPKNTHLQFPSSRISIAQPRVIAAISNARRVSEEFLCQTEDPRYTLWYDRIWYRTWVATSSKRTAKMSFNTDGLEMMRQFFSNLVPDILFLDEAHHFSKDIEILMLLAKIRRDINKKLVIMSATIDPTPFQEYFESTFWEVPFLDIPGRTFPVEEYSYDSLDELPDVVLWLLSEWKTWLFFVSGKWELYSYIEQFEAYGLDIPIYPLHAELPESEQILAIKNPDNEQRLIIATNVAEESITPEWVDFVIDLGTHKVSYPNDLWIEELVKENISQANSKQRAGRAGRTHNGEYHRFNSTKTDDLDAYPHPPIGKDMLDREILLFLNKWWDLKALHEEAKDRWETLFSHAINTKLLPISYERLYQIWAIDENHKITTLGKDLLTINLDIYHARMLLQAFSEQRVNEMWEVEWCLEEMIYIVCILSAKWFIGTDETWKKLFSSSWNKQTDLVHHLKLFIDFTSKKLSKNYTNKLAALWVNYKEIEAFQNQQDEWVPMGEREMFFEMVDLEPIGIKNHKIEEIYNKIFVIQSRLKKQWIDLDATKKPSVRNLKWKKLEDIQTCLHAGYPFFSFSYDNKKKKFVSRVQAWWVGNLEFQQAKTSLITPASNKTYSSYPFIIETDGGEDENLHLASWITNVSDYSIKKAYQTNIDYQTPFKTTGKKEHKIESLEELETIYLDLLDDVSKMTSRKDFMKIILPVLVLTKNHNFRKFISQAKNAKDINKTLQRLGRFFQHNYNTYKARIYLANVSKTENSFTHDSEIYTKFSLWEKNFMTKQAADKRTRKNMSAKENFDLHKSKELLEAKKKFIELAWWYKKNQFIVDLDSIMKDIFFRSFHEQSLSEGFEHIRNFAKANIKTITIEERKYISWLLWRRNKEKKKLSKHTSYKRHLKNVIEEIDNLLVSRFNIDIDFEFLHKFGDERYFVHEESKSQRHKYKKELNLLSKRGTKFFRARDQKRWLNHFKQLKNKLETAVKNVDLDIEYVQKVIETYDENPKLKDLKDHIESFLMSIFDGQTVIERIDSKTIDSLMKTIYSGLAEWKDSVEDIIALFLYEKFGRNVKTDAMKKFVKNESEYWDLISSLESSFVNKTSRENIKESNDIEYIIKATLDLENKMERALVLRNMFREMIGNKKY